MRLLHVCLGLALASTLLLFGTADEARSSFEPSTAPRVAATPPDTLQVSATAGTPLIRSLPATFRGTPVTRYTVLRGPALCGVAGRSLTCILEETQPGPYDISLHAHHPDAPSDTLVVRVNVQS
jgi:hypothetical protein